jgi:hypothetical protein
MNNGIIYLDVTTFGIPRDGKIHENYNGILK